MSLYQLIAGVVHDGCIAGVGLGHVAPTTADKGQCDNGLPKGHRGKVESQLHSMNLRVAVGTPAPASRQNR